MKTRILLAAMAGILGGSYIQAKYDQRQIKNHLPEILLEKESDLWHQAFHAGWTSAVDSPSIAYKHYTEFKDRLNQE